MFMISDGTRRFGSHVVFDGANISAEAGQIIGVSGRNGSGKSTLLRVVANVLRLHGGHRHGPTTCTYVPPRVEPPSLSPRRWVSGMARSTRSADSTFEVIAELGFEGDLDDRMAALSTGNMRKVLLAQALASQSSLIVLDEPASALDETSQATLAALISQRAEGGATIVVAEHNDLWLRALAIRSFTIERAHITEAIAIKRSPNTSVYLEGPLDHLDRLVSAASELGFREVTREAP